MALREYTGNAQPTTLNGGISSAAVSLTVADGTGYPTGAVAPFIITIDAGLASEEKILCASRTGNTITVATSGRGYDGTTASDHDNSASVAHTFSATDAREANAHVNATSAAHPASAVTFAPAGTVAATDVQAAIAELGAEADSHINATADGHDASAISFVPAATVVATTVQAAIEEVATEAVQKADTFRYVQTVDLPSIPANSSAEVTISTTAGTITSSATMVVYLAGISTHGLVVQRVVTAADQITLRVSNLTSSAIDAGSSSFVFLVIR